MSLATSWRKLNSVKKSVRGNYGPMVEHGLIIIGPYSDDKALTHVARVLSGWGSFCPKRRVWTGVSLRR